MIHCVINKELHGSNGLIELATDLFVTQGSFTALTGASGSGKTTLLRILAGLETVSYGKIIVDDEVWLDSEKKIFLPPQKRSIGFVFQDYALFMNMSVEENLLYVNKDHELAEELLEMTGLSALRDRYPGTLSGGQKQRVTLCRAMMKKPKLLLLDEPLSAIDIQMRASLQQTLLKLHQTFGMTTIMVSHDPSEIYRLSDRVLLMEQGSIVNDGTPKDILLKTRGSQKFSFEGEVLSIERVDLLYIAVIAIGQQLVEVVLNDAEAATVKAGDRVQVGTKAFAPMIAPKKV